jgi:hypothetical protein
MPWNSTFTKPNKPLARVGKVARRRLALVEELKEQARAEGWIDRCEIGPILKERGITFVRCSGPKTFAHSVKCSKRGKDPVLDRETARSCQTHHYYALDLLAPEQTAEIVREAIKRRK